MYNAMSKHFSNSGAKWFSLSWQKQHGEDGCLYLWRSTGNIYWLAGEYLVSIGNHESEWTKITCEVAQGSILGPLLFKMYMLPFAQINWAPQLILLYLYWWHAILYFSDVGPYFHSGYSSNQLMEGPEFFPAQSRQDIHQGSRSELILTLLLKASTQTNIITPIQCWCNSWLRPGIWLSSKW